MTAATITSIRVNPSSSCSPARILEGPSGMVGGDASGVEDATPLALRTRHTEASTGLRRRPEPGLTPWDAIDIAPACGPHPRRKFFRRQRMSSRRFDRSRLHAYQEALEWTKGRLIVGASQANGEPSYVSAPLLRRRILASPSGSSGSASAA